jgi:hypothetical protein
MVLTPGRPSRQRGGCEVGDDVIYTRGKCGDETKKWRRSGSGACWGMPWRSKTTARALNERVEISNMNWRRLITCCWVNAGG